MTATQEAQRWYTSKGRLSEMYWERATKKMADSSER